MEGNKMSYINKETGEEILIVPTLHVTFGDEDFDDDGSFDYVMGWALDGMQDISDDESYEELRAEYDEYESMSLEDKATITHQELVRMLEESGMRSCSWDYTKINDIYVKQNDQWEKKDGR